MWHLGVMLRWEHEAAMSAKLTTWNESLTHRTRRYSRNPGTQRASATFSRPRLQTRSAGASNLHGGFMSNRPDPNEQLVKVFDGEQESEALVVRGLLESAGIDSMMTAIDTDQELFPMGGVRILVREDQAEEARRVIEEHRDAAANDTNELSEPPE
jgi:hypothetical protein